MNILFFLPNGFDPDYGGTEKVVQTMSRWFSDDGHSIFFVSIYHPTDYIPDRPYLVLDEGGRKRPQAVRIKRFVDFVRAHGIDLIIDNYHHNHLRYIKVVVETVLRTGVKVIDLYHISPDAHERYFSSLGSVGEMRIETNRDLKRKLLGPKLMARIKRYLATRALRLRLKNYDKIVLLSEAYIPQAIAMTGTLHPEKYCAIHNAIGRMSDRPERTEKKNEVLWVGRMSPTKRPEKALKIWADIQDQYPDWRMVMLGSAELDDQIRSLVAKHNVRCELMGYQNPEPYYQTAKIFMMTSDLEGLPLVLIEAQRHGVVPVAFETFGALGDLIAGGKSGVAIPPNDMERYKQELARLMFDQEYWMTMSEEARKLSEEFTEEHIKPQWYALFEELGLKTNVK